MKYGIFDWAFPKALTYASESSRSEREIWLAGRGRQPHCEAEHHVAGGGVYRLHLDLLVIFQFVCGWE